MCSKTLFQKIIERTLPAVIEYEDDHCIVIHDINPQAPIHLLIIPKKPIASLTCADTTDAPLLGHLLLTAQHLQSRLKLNDGFRLVMNTGADAVPHVHIHLLAGKPMGWPPYASV